MTTTTLPPGRELDALIAEKVLGYVLANGTELGLLYGSRGRLMGPNPGTPPKWGACREIPHYSTDIAEAWVLVEKLCLWVIPVRGGWRWMACQEERPGVYLDEDMGVVDGHVENIGLAEKAPHAVCLAALAQCGVTD